MFGYSLKQSAPVLALVFHKVTNEKSERNGYYSSPDSGSFVVTEHRFIQAENGHTMSPASEVVSPEKFAEIIDSMDRARKIEKFKAKDGWVDENLIYQTDSLTVWFVPPGERSILYSMDSKEGKLQTQKATVSFLPMIFVVSKKKSLSVFYTDAKGARKDWKLFVPKLPNIYNSGAVCMGSAQIVECESAKGREENEQIFFLSKFSHSNMGEIIWDSFNCLLSGKAKPSLKKDAIALKNKSKKQITINALIEQLEIGQ